MTCLEILYDSNNFIVVNKPPDLLINSEDENEKNTLNHILSAQISTQYFNSSKLKHDFHFIHRLDYATSGVICLGKNKTASASAGKLFECRKVKKYYLAIVRGHMKNEFFTINISIGYDKLCLETNKKMRCKGENCIKPKEAITKVMVLETGSYDGEPATKIMLKPLTGRRHQLRLHCHLLGHTIVGDYTYSDRKDANSPRMFLHSYRLSLPIENENIDIQTTDPFPPSETPSAGWFSEKTINSSKAFDKIDDYESDTTITPNE